MTHRKPNGFTLLELMVTVALMAIIGVIAFPFYQAQTRKSNRPLAMTAVEKVAQAEQHYFTDKGVFTPTLTLLPGLHTTDYTSSRYTITVAVTARTATAPSTFLITATAVGSQANDTCKSFTLDNVGRRDGTPSRLACWGR